MPTPPRPSSSPHLSFHLLLPLLAAPPGDGALAPTEPAAVQELPAPVLAPLGAGPAVTTWQPLQADFVGPFASETDDAPNPFLDYRLVVTFTSPSGAAVSVPGFFNGDGAGGGTGDVWSARFNPDEPGTWTYGASFRQGTNVAVLLAPGAGTPTSFDGLEGSFDVLPPNPEAPGFWSRGRLEYVGGHYPRFQNGDWFLKGGTNSPENLLAYWGFDDVSNDGGFGVVHCYEPHRDEWIPGNPDFTSLTDVCNAPGGADDAKGLVGLLNYFAEVGVNAVYFMPMNLGGDAWDTSPFIDQSGTPYGNTHYDVSRLQQWEIVFLHAMRRGILLSFVLQETEVPNENWLDGGVLGIERRLFYRELVARFGHHPAIRWIHGEEWDLLDPASMEDLDARIEFMEAIDPYDHPDAVHNRVPFDDLAGLLIGNPRIEATSIQYATEAGIHQDEWPGEYVERWREDSTAAGTPWIVEMDENNPLAANATTVDLLRKQVTYPVFLSGGHLEWYYESPEVPTPDVFLEDLGELDLLFRQTTFARELVESRLDFWEAQPADQRLVGEATQFEGGQVFADGNGCFLVYLPRGSETGTLELPPGKYRLEWFDPRNMTGGFAPKILPGGGPSPLGPPPELPGEDWVAVVDREPGLALGLPQPGVPGTINSLPITDAAPNSSLVLLFSNVPGALPLPPCPGLALDFFEPLIGGLVSVDATGTGAWSPFFPQLPPGTAFSFQLWDALGCEVSNSVAYTWE